MLSSSGVTESPEEQISWLETPAHAPVIANDEAEVGRVVEVAALRDEDIFHGVVFRHASTRKEVLAPAADVVRITRSAVHLCVDASATAAYEPFHQMHISRIGLRGLFGWKHFGWKDAGE